MIYFNCDYAEGAHKRIMARLVETNMLQTVGYGMDEFCEEARATIRRICNAPNADVQFLVGGTQTNATVISAALRPYQGVICAKSGHINVHETGAVESCGYKVLALPAEDGKITAAQIEEAYRLHMEDESREHMVQPGMVYISQSTELGTTYNKAELTAIYDVCRRHGIYLFIDGARLGYGLMAEDCDLAIEDIARLCDVFYIGGTKMGALFGEAVVISHPGLKQDFRYLMKQKGGMLAKGRLLGIQFQELLSDGLYWELGRRADVLADRIVRAFEGKGIGFLVQNHTNQVFPVLPDAYLDRLWETYRFSYQERVDKSHSAVRFCTSWATNEEDVTRLCEDIAAL